MFVADEFAFDKFARRDCGGLNRRLRGLVRGLAGGLAGRRCSGRNSSVTVELVKIRHGWNRYSPTATAMVARRTAAGMATRLFMTFQRPCR